MMPVYGGFILFLIGLFTGFCFGYLTCEEMNKDKKKQS